MSHPTTLHELFEHIRHYEPLVSATYDPWFNEAIEREQRSQAQSAAYEARIQSLSRALRIIADAWAHYRNCYKEVGAGDGMTFRAWDLLDRAEAKARTALQPDAGEGEK